MRLLKKLIAYQPWRGASGRLANKSRQTSADTSREPSLKWGPARRQEDHMKTMLPDLWTRDFVADPFRALERELFGRDLPKTFDLPKGMTMAPVPAMNIAETEKTIEATLEIPGVDEKDIKVRVEGDRLIVSGEKTIEIKKDEKDWHVMERRFGSFNRSVLLPFEPAVDAIAANYDKGVLHLTVQKPAAKETAAKTIPVQSGAPKPEEPQVSH
jgi:HSP20 family protein